MTAAEERPVPRMSYVTALTGMYGDAKLEVTDPESSTRFAFDGKRGDQLVVAFPSLEARYPQDPIQLDERGRLTPEAIATLQERAHRQVAVANERHILWACARARDAELLQELLAGPLADLRTGEGVAGIEVAYLPAQMLRRQWLERVERGLWAPPLNQLPDLEPAAEPGPREEHAPDAGTPQPDPGTPLAEARRTVKPIVPPDAGGPIPETLLPGDHRPVRFGGSRSQTSIAVPLGIPGQLTTVGNDIPQRPIELGGEATLTVGFATLLWDFLGTVPPGTSIASVLHAMATPTSGMPAIEAFLQLQDLGLVALVDVAEPAAVHAFAKVYRLIPTTHLPPAAPAGQKVRVLTPSGQSAEVDGLLISILGESHDAPDLASACALHGPVHGPDHRPRLFKAPNLRRRHASQTHENGAVGWVLEESLPLIGSGVVAFELAATGVRPPTR